LKRLYPDQPVVGVGAVVLSEGKILLEKRVSLDEAGKVKYHFVIIDYLVTVKCGQVKAASDADALMWVPFNEVEGYNLTRSFRNFFQRNRQRLEQV
jgi:hypothetical protein